jgi:hypothetical protein
MCDNAATPAPRAIRGIRWPAAARVMKRRVLKRPAGMLKPAGVLKRLAGRSGICSDFLRCFFDFLDFFAKSVKGQSFQKKLKFL